jgi:MYXO-CTERM domain-containing protein
VRYELHTRFALAVLASLVSACAGRPDDQEPTGIESAPLVDQCLPDSGAAPPEGIDVYSGNGPVDWTEAKKDGGISWAILKATQGTYDDDTAFAANWAAAKDAGVARGAYHFFDPTLDGGAQAQYFLKKMGPLDAEDLSPVIDIECPTDPVTPNCLYTGASGEASGADIRARMLDWMNEVEVATGRKPIVYSGAYYFTGASIDTTGLDAYPLWVAAYPGPGVTCVSLPAPWEQAVAWQYSGSGSMAGVTGEVDLDRMISSIDELTGWPAIKHASRADVNGDGKADVCGRDPTGVVCATATSGGFSAPFAGPAWSDAEGWMPARYASTVQFGDVNGDGKGDACARASAGITCALSTGTGFGTPFAGPAWSDAAGWTRPEYYATVQLADVNGDGMSDVCGRGAAGITCVLSTGTGFGTPFAGPAWSDAAGWNVPNWYRTIRFPDVDGDGKSDVCGRSSDGIHCALSTGAGFGADFLGPAWGDAEGWGRAAYASTIQFVDVSGDHKADVCGRSDTGIVCEISMGTGFGAPVAGPAWSDAAGWNAPMYYATIVFPDLNGDGASDICGRGPSGMTCALSTPTAVVTEFPGPAWSDAEGWNEPRYYGTIGAGDIDGDGNDDLCARGATGVTCALSTGASFGAAIAGPAWSDATWGVAPYWATVATVGHAKHASDGDGGLVDSGAPNESDGSVSFSVSGSVSGSAGCSCRAAKNDSAPFGAPFALSALALALVRRKRR